MYFESALFILFALIWGFCIIMSTKQHPRCEAHEQDVTGIGSAIFPAAFKPTAVAVEFCDGHSNVHPSCNPVPIDQVSSHIVEILGGWGVKISWQVANERKIKWVVCGHSQ